MNITDLKKISATAEKKYLAAYDFYYESYFALLKKGVKSSKAEKILKKSEEEMHKLHREWNMAVRAIIIARR